jgi:phosphoribosylamine-glycine ligase
MKNDLLEFYFHLCEGNPERLEFNLKATVLVYVVPPTYGGKSSIHRDIVLNLPELFELNIAYDRLLIPGDVEVRADGRIYARTSRSVAAVAVGGCLDEASQKANKLAVYVEDNSDPRGLLWHRGDVGAKEHVNKSIQHRRILRERFGF